MGSKPLRFARHALVEIPDSKRTLDDAFPIREDGAIVHATQSRPQRHKLYPALRPCFAASRICCPMYFQVDVSPHINLTEVCLWQLTSLVVHDLCRALDGACRLRVLLVHWLEWPLTYFDNQVCSHRRRESSARLRHLDIRAEPKWITDTRSVLFLDWLSSSEAISQVEIINFKELMLIDEKITFAVKRILCAARTSPRLYDISLSFSPDVELSASELI